ncbi:MAG: NADH-quinone oxidoreductase subunit NuoF [Thermodesulfobacteriota bacterium]
MPEQVLLKNVNLPDSHKIDTYMKSGGYGGLKRALKEYSSEELIQLVKDSGLRGRGGAGFPTGLKWSFVPKNITPRYLCCNADEGEPGTFKDRVIIENDPHMLVEGMVITSYAIGAALSFIYIRGEFAYGAKVLEDAIEEAHDKGYLGKNILGSGFDHEIIVHRGAGAYICGEETALIESLEGKRGQPRLKPPFPAIAGLYGKPTVVNNVETLALIPHFVMRGVEWFAAIGPEKSPGLRLFAISGHVKKPGVYEAPMGIPLQELIDQYAGGPLDGRTIKGVIPGGVSAPIIPAKDLDIRMDFDSLAAYGSMGGSGAVIVMDETTCMVKVITRIIEFFHHESCGKCTPCREGLEWAAQVLSRIENGVGREGDVKFLEDMCSMIFGNTFCPLGDGAVMALRGFMKHYVEEFHYHIKEKRCMV